jgi:hypothetical protein
MIAAPPLVRGGAAIIGVLGVLAAARRGPPAS